jgi:hypothetical protein
MSEYSCKVTCYERVMSLHLTKGVSLASFRFRRFPLVPGRFCVRFICRLGGGPCFKGTRVECDGGGGMLPELTGKLSMR